MQDYTQIFQIKEEVQKNKEDENSPTFLFSNSINLVEWNFQFLNWKSESRVEKNPWKSNASMLVYLEPKIALNLTVSIFALKAKCKDSCFSNQNSD